jgi:hypothetical protein
MSKKTLMKYSEIVDNIDKVFKELNVNYYALKFPTVGYSPPSFMYAVCYGDPNIEVVAVYRVFDENNKTEEWMQIWGFEKNFHITEKGFYYLKNFLYKDRNTMHFCLYINNKLICNEVRANFGKPYFEDQIMSIINWELSSENDNKDSLILLLEKYGQIDIEVKLGIFGSTKKFTYTKEKRVTKVL